MGNIQRIKIYFMQEKLINILTESNTIIPIARVATAIKVMLSYKVNKKATEEQQLLEFGFEFDKATEAQKNLVIILSRSNFTSNLI